MIREPRLIPIERAIYARGHSDGERGNAPQSSRYEGRQREIYERAFGKGYDARYRDEYERKRHGSAGKTREADGGSRS